MAPNPTDGNGKVNMAILGLKMDHLTGLLQAHIDRESEKKHEERIVENTLGVARLGERMKLITWGLVGLQAIGSTVAAFLGVR